LAESKAKVKCKPTTGHPDKQHGYLVSEVKKENEMKKSMLLSCLILCSAHVLADVPQPLSSTSYGFPENLKGHSTYEVDDLTVRVAGFNLINSVVPPYDPVSPTWFHFVPSVTNTGPQAIYVCEILRRFAQKLVEEKELKSEVGPKMFPTELLSMIVSFDKDGNPVSSVDLAKYRLSMPVITPKPDPNFAVTDGFFYTDPTYNNTYTITFPHETGNTTETKKQNVETSNVAKTGRQPHEKEPPPPEQPEKSLATKIFLWFSVLALLAVIGGAMMWRKERSK
jgi:hypothetical protein